MQAGGHGYSCTFTFCLLISFCCGFTMSGLAIWMCLVVDEFQPAVTTGAPLLAHLCSRRPLDFNEYAVGICLVQGLGADYKYSHSGSCQQVATRCRYCLVAHVAAGMSHPSRRQRVVTSSKKSSVSTLLLASASGLWLCT